MISHTIAAMPPSWQKVTASTQWRGRMIVREIKA
jgi:hypothetical protein